MVGKIVIGEPGSGCSFIVESTPDADLLTGWHHDPTSTDCICVEWGMTGCPAPTYADSMACTPTMPPSSNSGPQVGMPVSHTPCRAAFVMASSVIGR